jgi:predicted ferric reductase
MGVLFEWPYLGYVLAIVIPIAVSIRYHYQEWSLTKKLAVVILSTVLGYIYVVIITILLGGLK